MAFKAEIYDPRPKGGQHVGIATSVKVTHEPTGLFAVCGYERSQHRNKRIAQAMVEYGLAELGWEESHIDPAVKPIPSLDTCPKCGGVADNGFDREYPPNPYLCTKCNKQKLTEQINDTER